MKKTCFLLMTCNVAHSYGLEHGVFLDEVEAVAEMWRLASTSSRCRGIPVGDSGRHFVVVGDTCFRLREITFFG